MAEDPPISTTVPETTTIDTGADKESLENLNANFEDFWKEADNAPEAPEAPGEGAAQETKETLAEVKSKPEPKRVESSRTLEPEKAKEFSDEEIDKLVLPSNFEAKPEHEAQFKEIKQLWLADRAKVKTEAERAATLERQLAEARQNSWTPEAKADYEHAAAIRRKFDFVSDPEFIAQYHAPIRSKFEQVLDETVAALPDKQAASAWADYIKANYTPEQLDRNWWQHSVLAKVPDEMDRSSLLSSITEMAKMQKARDSEIQKRTNDQSSFQNWIQEKAEHTTKRVQEEIMTEINIQEQKIQDVLPRDVSKAKTQEERRAIEDHNERFTKLNTFFQDTMKDLSAHGPRAWVRASVEATRAQLLEGEYKEMEKELKSAKAERDQYKTELEKITGARRKISHTTGTPPSGSSKSNGQGLSLKNLDIRKAFDEYSWGDET